MLAQTGAAFAKGLTLDKALAETYLKNPDIEAIRAELRGVNETYAQAMAGFKPYVSGVADYASAHNNFHAGVANSDPKSLSLQVTQSLYSGGSTMASVDVSDNQIKAERAKLKVTEQQVLLAGVVAYMDLMRDQEIVQLNLNNEKVLKTHLDASKERFKLGDITKTDVSQSQSRYSKATADRIAAEGELKKSRATFEKVIGLPPDGLQKPVITFKFPQTEEQAISLALQKNPAVALAKFTENAAKANTRSIEGEKLPEVDVFGTVSKVYDPITTLASNDENSKTVEVRATVPLYTGGSITSRIRQSRQAENQLRMQTHSTERVVRESVVEAREELAAAEAESKALQSQINAAKLALEGVQVENNYGTRTTLDLLDAQQEYLTAQVSHVSAETDRIVAAYGFLAALGELTAEDLHLNIPIYNPATGFQNQKHPGFTGHSMGISK